MIRRLRRNIMPLQKSIETCSIYLGFDRLGGRGSVPFGILGFPEVIALPQQPEHVAASFDAKRLLSR